MQKVLIIEDDNWLAEQHARSLNSANYETKIVFHAIDGMQAIDDFHPDVILLDILLTGSTAFVLLHELQSYDDTGKIPIIVCTNLASDIDIKNLKPYGVRQILDKAVMRPDDLVAAVKSVLI